MERSVTARPVSVDGRPALRVALTEQIALLGKPGVDYVDQPTFLVIPVSFSDGTIEASMPLDGDEFYLSIAPYETTTHECYFHNLGSCQGELADVEVRVRITTDSGEVLVDEDATTYANGFIGFWIPKDVAGTVVVTKDGKRAESRFSSDAEGPTCLTTLQLL